MEMLSHFCFRFEAPVCSCKCELKAAKISHNPQTGTRKNKQWTRRKSRTRSGAQDSKDNCRLSVHILWVPQVVSGEW